MKRPTPINIEKPFREGEVIVSKTDTQGRITYGNKIFIELSGYTEKELMGSPHNIVRHPDMPRLVFATLWEGIRAKKEVPAYVKNLSKDGKFYWVLAYVTASCNEAGDIIGYHSIRVKPRAEAVKAIIPIYQNLIAAEKSGGMSASKEILNKLLEERGMCYEQYVLSI